MTNYEVFDFLYPEFSFFILNKFDDENVVFTQKYVVRK